MQDKHLICTDCGGDTHTEALPDNRLNNVTDTQPVEVRKVVCNHCDSTGQVIVSAGMNPSKNVSSGPFAQVTTDGMKTLRENLGFVPVYER